MHFETEILTSSWSWTFKLSVFELIDKLCLHKGRLDKSDQAFGPELQNAKILCYSPFETYNKILDYGNLTKNSSLT
jgi:hypothetical protein